MWRELRLRRCLVNVNRICIALEGGPRTALSSCLLPRGGAGRAGALAGEWLLCRELGLVGRWEVSTVRGLVVAEQGCQPCFGLAVGLPGEVS